VKNEGVLHRVKEERKLLHTVNRRKANWICHILRRNCLLKHFFEGKIELTGRRGRRRKQTWDDLKEKIGYGELKEKALDGTVCRTHLGRSYGPVIKTDYRMNE
jgi:hypothetical protein